MIFSFAVPRPGWGLADNEPSNNEQAMKKPKQIIVTSTITMIVTVDKALPIDAQRKELEENMKALYDLGFEQGKLTQDTDCDFITSSEITTSIAI